MAEQTTTETVEPDQTDAATAEATEGQDQEQSSEVLDENREGLKAALKKANKDAERNRRLHRETETQKKTVDEENVSLKEQIAERDARIAAQDARMIAFEMVVTYNLPPDLIHLLSGTDREEIEKNAKALKAHLKPANATDFDSGPRDVVEKPLSVEEQHQARLVELLRAKGKLPPT